MGEAGAFLALLSLQVQAGVALGGEVRNRCALKSVGIEHLTSSRSSRITSSQSSTVSRPGWHTSTSSRRVRGFCGRRGGGRWLLQHASEGLGEDDGGVRGPGERSPALRPLRHVEGCRRRPPLLFRELPPRQLHHPPVDPSGGSRRRRCGGDRDRAHCRRHYGGGGHTGGRSRGEGHRGLKPLPPHSTGES